MRIGLQKSKSAESYLFTCLTMWETLVEIKLFQKELPVKNEQISNTYSNA